MRTQQHNTTQHHHATSAALLDARCSVLELLGGEDGVGPGEGCGLEVGVEERGGELEEVVGTFLHHIAHALRLLHHLALLQRQRARERAQLLRCNLALSDSVPCALPRSESNERCLLSSSSADLAAQTSPPHPPKISLMIILGTHPSSSPSDHARVTSTPHPHALSDSKHIAADITISSSSNHQRITTQHDDDNSNDDDEEEEGRMRTDESDAAPELSCCILLLDQLPLEQPMII
eukprot:410575-Rhodomonas_salina.2